MPPACVKPISVHTLVWTLALVQVPGQRENQQASVGLFRTGERTVNSLSLHVLYSYVRGLCGVGGPSTQPFSPLVECGASIEVSCSDAQRDSVIGSGQRVSDSTEDLLSCRSA